MNLLAVEGLIVEAVIVEAVLLAVEVTAEDLVEVAAPPA